MTSLRIETASQTAGPYVHIGLVPARAGIEQVQIVSHDLCPNPSPPGALVIEVSGHILDGSGSPIEDAVIELWQADHHGQYAKSRTSDFRGWGRSAIDPESGRYRFRTIKPGAVPHRGSAFMAPHLAFWIIARGINLGLHTRMYFPEDAQAHLSDPVINTIEPKCRRSTLIASSTDEATLDSVDKSYVFNIVIQGHDETVFFDI